MAVFTFIVAAGSVNQTVAGFNCFQHGFFIYFQIVHLKYAKTLHRHFYAVDFPSKAKSISGEIHIGAGEICGMRIVTKAISELHKSSPDIKFHLYSDDDEITTERLNKGLLDFRMSVGITNLPNMIISNSLSSIILVY